jgi:hypothetical protein
MFPQKNGLPRSWSMIEFDIVVCLLVDFMVPNGDFVLFFNLQIPHNFSYVEKKKDSFPENRSHLCRIAHWRRLKATIQAYEYDM